MGKYSTPSRVTLTLKTCSNRASLPQKREKSIHPDIRIRYSPLPKENSREAPASRAAAVSLALALTLSVMVGLDPTIHAPRPGLACDPDSRVRPEDDGGEGGEACRRATAENFRCIGLLASLLPLPLSLSFSLTLSVMVGLDPAIHAPRPGLACGPDPRVRPEDDGGEGGGPCR